MTLRATGLVRAAAHGRRRPYRIDGQAMADAMAPWLRRYEPYWAAALDRLRRLAEHAEPPP